MTERNKKFLYYIYVLLILLILWAAFQLVKISQKTTESQPVKHGEVFQDTLTFYVSQVPQTFDVFNALYDQDIFVFSQIYRGLTRINSNLVEVPDLAEYWDVSDDHKTYTFYLRRGLYFHDGMPVTMDDFIQSVEFFFSHYPKSYTISYFKIIDGVEEFMSGRSKKIRGIRKISDYAVEIRLTKPYVPFPKLLSLPQMRILPHRYLASDYKALCETPIGTGPYRVVKKSNEYLVLEAFYLNKIYEPSVKYFKLIPVLLSKNRAEVMKQHSRRKFDISFIPDSSFLHSSGDLKFRKNTTFNLVFLGFNCMKAPTDQADFRKALFAAFNSREISEKYRGNAIPAEFISPIFLPKEPGENHSISSVLNGENKKSSNHLSSLGQFREITFLLDTTHYIRDFSDEIKRIGDTLGFKSNHVFLNDLDIETQQSLLDTVNTFIFDWQLDLPDPEYFFNLLFKSDSPMNLFNYKNPEVDSLLEVARFKDISSDRLKLYSQIEDIIYQDAPMRPIIYFEDYMFYKDYIEGAYLSRLGIPSLELDKISVDKELYEKHNWKK
ncbi:MAG: ABC transporter substrate-binding protein [Calditrichia bacterium]